MKRIFALFALSAILFSLTACGGSVRVAGDGALEGGFPALRIAVDAGHGGIDNGATGTDTGTPEDMLNLEIAQRIAKKFILKGSDVLLTRKSDEVDYSGTGGTKKRRDMNNRARMIQEQDSGIVVSIHMNKYPNRKLAGAQVFFEKGSEEGEKLARCIQEALNEGLGAARKLQAKAGDYFILKAADCPSVIVECGFLSNAEEEKRLLDASYRQQLSDCIYEGICTYLGIE